MSCEKWSKINSFPNYSVSDHGRIKRLKGYRCKTDRILALTGSNNCGYVIVGLWDYSKCYGNKCYGFSLHRLILEAFISKAPEGTVCHHIDGNKKNNKLSNLEWISPKDNMRHAYGTGLAHGGKGEQNSQAKLTDNKVLMIRYLYKKCGMAYFEIGKLFRVDGQSISNIINLKSWAHI